MVGNYSLGDFLIRIKNASMAGRRTVTVPQTKLIKSVAETLKRGKFLESVETEGKDLVVRIAYHKKSPLVMDVKLISKPGRRVYMSADELKSKKGPFIFIVSTSQGILLSNEAIKKGHGGEVLAKIL